MFNDLTTAAPIYKYTDNCTVFEVTSYSGATSDLQMHHLESINQWITDRNRRIKTKELNICLAKSRPVVQPLKINNVPSSPMQ